MLAPCLQCWASIEQTLGVFAGGCLDTLLVTGRITLLAEYHPNLNLTL